MMTATECWLLALADPEGTPGRLPHGGLAAPEIATLAALAEMHGVLPAVLTRAQDLLRTDPARILQPPAAHRDALALLQPGQLRLAQRSAMAMYLAAEARKLVRELGNAGVEAIVLKGADFASRLYRTPALRPFGDIDLLVRNKDWAGVAETMSRLGYVSRETPLKYSGGYSEQTWEHPAMPGAMVEVHDNLVNSPTVRRGVSVKLDDLPLEREARNGLRPTPAGLLVIATVHGAASHGFDKLQHLCDITQIVRGRAGSIDTSALRECLDRTGAGLSMAVGLDLAAQAFNEPPAAELLSQLKLRRPRLARLLVTPALVARSQGMRRRGVSWRRQWFRQLLKSRP